MHPNVKSCIISVRQCQTMMRSLRDAAHGLYKHLLIFESVGGIKTINNLLGGFQEPQKRVKKMAKMNATHTEKCKMVAW